ncbi:MAG: methyltransferase domain-containing protein [Pirellulales bacterium]|nr:methyltransferase domain-containing protein [Pirellulales bacterium]
MSLTQDLKTLYHLSLSPIRGQTHAERLKSFYGKQAEGYDDFRRRLLPGRETLYRALPAPAGGRWLEMGGGTGANLEFLGERIRDLGHVDIVDLCGPLLEIAQRRIADRGWTNVHTTEYDATTFQAEPYDVITFSYSLTMIPDWFAALERATALLKPGGMLGVVDFYVSRKHPDQGRARHGWLTRSFWPFWFNRDNVFPNPDHLPYLQRHFTLELLEEGRAKVPYVPFARVPYYVFVGRKG